MAVDYLTIASGFNVSSAHAIVRGDLQVAIVFPGSAAAADYRVQCAVSSGASASGDVFGDAQPLFPLQNPMNPLTVYSGGITGSPVYVIFGPAPTPFIRLRSLNAAGAVLNQTLTSTFTLITVRPAS